MSRTDAKTIVAIEDLTPDPANANAGTERGLRMLDDSLREDGAGRSILADRDGMVIAGNKTLQRAADLGLPLRVVETDGHELVVVQRVDLDLDGEGDEQVRARRMAYRDNRAGEVGLQWDIDQLLADVSEGVDLSGVFRDDEIEELLAEVRAAEAPDDPGAQIDRAAELQEVWGTALGQVWELGEHRLAVGDCTDGAVVDAAMRGERVGAVVTDPPYGQNQPGVPYDAPENLHAMLSGCVRGLPITDAVIIAFASPRTFLVWLDLIREHGHTFERMLWLYKEAQEAFPWRGWILKSEAILVSSVGSAVWREQHPFAHDCYKVSEVSFRTEQIAAVRTHGSIKPITVVQDLVSRVAGDVYDPFLGSGTTLIACERLRRRCRGIEIDPGYCAVAIQRWVDMTQGEPQLVG